MIIKFQIVDKRHVLGLPQGLVAAQEKRSETSLNGLDALLLRGVAVDLTFRQRLLELFDLGF